MWRARPPQANLGAVPGATLLIADDPVAGALLAPGELHRGAPATDPLAGRLLADPAEAFSTELPGEDFWSRFYVVARAPCSQFDVLRDHLAGGGALPGPVACLALTGEGFHGHRGRSWTAEPGNLHLSAAIPAGGLAAEHALALTMLPAVAAADALRRLGFRPGLKWVNDVLLGGRKVAGVLTTTQSRGELLESAVLGVGLNVARTPAVALSPFVPRTTCLAAESPDAPPDLGDATRAVLDALADRWRDLRAAGPARLFADYRGASLAIGRAVRVWPEGIAEDAPPERWPAPLARGVVADLLPDLSLVFAGRSAAVDRGRLAFEESCREFGL